MRWYPDQGGRQRRLQTCRRQPTDVMSVNLTESVCVCGVQPKEEVQQDVLEKVTGAMQWQRETAADAGMTAPEFHELNTMYQEVALGEMVQEMSEKMGVDAGQVMSTALMFTDRTRADAERVGLTHDEYLGAICEVRGPPRRHCRAPYTCLGSRMACMHACVCSWPGDGCVPCTDAVGDVLAY